MLNMFKMKTIVSILLILFRLREGQSTGEFSGRVRQAPFCVDATKDSKLANFKPIFDYHNANPGRFIPVSPDRFQSPTGFIENITFTRLMARDKRTSKDTRPVRFQHTFHVHLKASEKVGGMEGLFVQAIGVPLGVPFGGFASILTCSDCKVSIEELKRMAAMTAITPCSFRPAASKLQPYVLSIGGFSSSHTKFKDAHFKFRYVDHSCYGPIYVQFLVIAVRRFVEPPLYDIFFTSLYKLESAGGTGSPYHMYKPWNKNKLKVKYNEEFDRCTVTSNQEISLGGGNICPPDPVSCGNVTGESNELVSQALIQNLTRRTDMFCDDCGEWEETIGEVTWEQPAVSKIIRKHQDATSASRIPPGPIFRSAVGLDCHNGKGKKQNGSRSSGRNCNDGLEAKMINRGWIWGHKVLTIHGLLMIFAWTACSNCLIFCSRFLKEASPIQIGSGCAGIGAWLWSHIIWVYLAAVALWTSVGLVGLHDPGPICELFETSKDTNTCTAKGGTHKVLGGMALTFFHMSFLTGWFRPQYSSKMRILLIVYHVVCGYVAKYFGLLALLTVPRLTGKSTILFLCLMEIFFWLVFIVATLIQQTMDTRDGSHTRDRKCLPVQEAIDTVEFTPNRTWRSILFPAYVVIQIALFCAFCIFQLGIF